MKAAADDLAARAPVWQALSLLYLDSETTGVYDEAASVLAASPYSLAELREILVYEVNPVLHWNLLSAAGEWQGFCQDWLCEQILRRQHWPRWWRRLATQTVPKNDWPAIAARVEQRRNTDSLRPLAPGTPSPPNPPLEGEGFRSTKPAHSCISKH